MTKLLPLKNKWYILSVLIKSNKNLFFNKEFIMKKQGFTLIELMVVVVIIGILAAVAVPKLFGMIAKSKASEVGPAAGTYVKLQQAYISEAVAVGNWIIIGYSGPGTANADKLGSSATNFTYHDDGTSYSNNTAELGSSAITGWSASNKAQLNDCPAAKNWTVSVKSASSGTAGEATFTAAIASDNSAKCTPLTPNFAKIGQ